MRDLGGQGKQPPFFVVGAQRSGTTMLRLMLNAHPDVAVPFESGFLVKFYWGCHRYGDLGVPANAARLLADISDHPYAKKARLVEDREAILDRPIRNYADMVDAIFGAYAAARGKSRWGDKTPTYVTDVDVLRAVFPRCKIIHLVRDGRDVAISNRSISWGSRNVPKVASDWRWKTLLAHKVGRLLGDDYLLVQYEKLVLCPEQSLRVITEFLGIEYSDVMLGYTRDASSEMPAESLRWHGNSIRPPDPGLVEQWRYQMSRSDRIIFEQIACDALETFGYSVERRAGTIGSRMKNLYYATVARC